MIANASFHCIIFFFIIIGCRGHNLDIGIGGQSLRIEPNGHCLIFIKLSCFFFSNLNVKMKSISLVINIFCLIFIKLTYSVFQRTVKLNDNLLLYLHILLFLLLLDVPTKFVNLIFFRLVLVNVELQISICPYSHLSYIDFDFFPLCICIHFQLIHLLHIHSKRTDRPMMHSYSG